MISTIYYFGDFNDCAIKFKKANPTKHYFKGWCKKLTLAVFPISLSFILVTNGIYFSLRKNESASLKTLTTQLCMAISNHHSWNNVLHFGLNAVRLRFDDLNHLAISILICDFKIWLLFGLPLRILKYNSEIYN